mmetsp:Transcript_43479/g.114694  ORF Transcript_43479/g.114694 Transcript_43479/m.114694 type:complete len:458 (-) Transcript_43479:58-1431(-)
MNATLKRQFEEAVVADEVVAKQKQTKGREIGVVEAYDKSKGFGFIVDSDQEKLFVHQSMIVCPGFRRLADGQKVSFTRGEDRGKPWAEDVRNPDGSPIVHEREEEAPVVAKKRRQQLKEQWRNFFDIPQYALKGYGESLPALVNNQDSFVTGDTMPQLGKAFIMSHGCCATRGVGNECSRFIKDKLPKIITKAYEEKGDPETALPLAFEMAENEYMERAKMKSFTDGAEVTVALYVHALNSGGQPCVQLWMANVGTCVAILCGTEGEPIRLTEPHSVAKARPKLVDAGFKVGDGGVVEVSFAEVGEHKPSSYFKLPGSRLIGGRPFKTSSKAPVHARPDIKKAREWRCVAGEELFLVVCSREVLSVLSDKEVMTVALDAWGSNAEGLDGCEAASKAVVRTAQAQGPASDTLACLVVQNWWQEKPLQRLLARRAERQRAGLTVGRTTAVEVEAFDMFS